MDVTQPAPEEELRAAREQVDEAASALSRVLEEDQELVEAAGERRWSTILIWRRGIGLAGQAGGSIGSRPVRR